MAQGQRRLQDMSMISMRKVPRIGDRVRIVGFVGDFQVVKVWQNGIMADLRHLGSAGPDYIEKEILSRDLIYPDPPRPSTNQSASQTQAFRAPICSMTNPAKSG
jgi:hypothetical protein